MVDCIIIFLLIQMTLERWPALPLRLGNRGGGEAVGCYLREKLSWQGSGKARKEIARYSSGEEFLFEKLKL